MSTPEVLPFKQKKGQAMPDPELSVFSASQRRVDVKSWHVFFPKVHPYLPKLSVSNGSQFWVENFGPQEHEQKVVGRTGGSAPRRTLGEVSPHCRQTRRDNLHGFFHQKLPEGTRGCYVSGIGQALELLAVLNKA